MHPDPFYSEAETENKQENFLRTKDAVFRSAENVCTQAHVHKHKHNHAHEFVGTMGPN